MELAELLNEKWVLPGVSIAEQSSTKLSRLTASLAEGKRAIVLRSPTDQFACHGPFCFGRLWFCAVLQHGRVLPKTIAN